MTFASAVSLSSSFSLVEAFDVQYEGVVASRRNYDRARSIDAPLAYVRYVEWYQWQPRDRPCSWSSVFLSDTGTGCRNIHRYPKRRADMIMISILFVDNLSYPIFAPRVSSKKMTGSIVIADNQHCMWTCHSDSQTRWVGHRDVSVILLHFRGGRVQ